MRPRSLVYLRAVQHPRYRYLATWSEGGRRNKKYFRHGEKSHADAWCQAKRIELESLGHAAREIADVERRAIYDFRDRIEGHGKSLREALEFYVQHLERTHSPCKVSELADRLLTRLEREGKSRYHIQDLAYRIRRFEKDFGDRDIFEITTEEIDRWLAGLELAPQTVKNYRDRIRNLFGEAVRLRLLSSNPVIDALTPKVCKSEVGILQPEALEALLAAADPELIPPLAISFFAGVRREELHGLDWSEVDLGRGFIEIKAAKAKSARRRLIKIEPNLAAWLTPYRHPGGPVMPTEMRFRRLLTEAREASELPPLPHNAGRHSYASYHLAHFRNASDLALQLGHHNTEVLFAHYRELVSPDAGAAYWKICPGSGSENVVALQAHG